MKERNWWVERCPFCFLTGWSQAEWEVPGAGGSLCLSLPLTPLLVGSRGSQQTIWCPHCWITSATPALLSSALRCHTTTQGGWEHPDCIPNITYVLEVSLLSTALWIQQDTYIQKSQSKLYLSRAWVWMRLRLVPSHPANEDWTLSS